MFLGYSQNEDKTPTGVGLRERVTAFTRSLSVFFGEADVFSGIVGLKISGIVPPFSREIHTNTTNK